MKKYVGVVAGSVAVTLVFLMTFQDKLLINPKSFNILVFKYTTSVVSSATKAYMPDMSLDNNVQGCPTKRKIVIVFWDSYWNWPDFGMGLGNVGFEKYNCSCTNCFTTTNKKLSQSADAIIFHGQNVPQDDVSALMKLKQERLERGTGYPLFIYFQKESPRYNVAL